MRPFSTYPEERTKMLALSSAIEEKSTFDEDYVKAADELADLVKAILMDEQAVLDAEMFDQMTEEFSQTVEQSWQKFKHLTEEEDRAAREAQEILDHKALRDRFAIAALPKVMAAVTGNVIPVERIPAAVAQAAYVFADALLKERDR